MVKRLGGIYVLLGLLLIFLIMDIGLATWLLTPPLTRRHIVQPGETLADIASRYEIHEQVLIEKNDLLPGTLVEPGQVLSIPMPPLAPLLEWELPLVGLGVTVFGVLVSLWLCRVGGLLPTGIGVRITVIAVAVAAAHYVTVQLASSQASVVISPLSILNWVKDGFAWSVGLLLLARVLGFGQRSA